MDSTKLAPVRMPAHNFRARPFGSSEVEQSSAERRDFLRRLAYGASATALGPLITGCGGGDGQTSAEKLRTAMMRDTGARTNVMHNLGGSQRNHLQDQRSKAAALLKHFLMPGDFAGINTSNGAIVRPEPPDGVAGPGFDSSTQVNLSLPMTAQYQYNRAYWSVIQCGQNKASVWLNGWGHYVPKDTPNYQVSGLHLGFAGGREAPNGDIWVLPQDFMQLNHVEEIGNSYHENGAYTQNYWSLFFYCPAVPGYEARSLNYTILTWASQDTGWFRENIFVDTNTPGVGTYASTMLRPGMRYITSWGGDTSFGSQYAHVPRLLGACITYQNMRNMLLDYIAKSGLPSGHYDKPENWKFNGAGLQLEAVWPDIYRPSGGGPLPGQAGVVYSGVNVTVWRGS